MKTYIVYHCFLVKKWKELVLEQLDRLNSTGLLSKADKVYCIVVDVDNNRDEFSKLIAPYPNIEVIFYRENQYELFAITKVWELGQSDDCNVMYFHTKGVFNDYEKYGKDKLSTSKINGIRDWRKMMEYFCIDKWQQNLSLLNTVDMVGTTCNGNWWWGNFWWARSSYLKTINKPSGGSRWDYEAWVNRDGKASKHEHYRFTFTPYFTTFPEKLYKYGTAEKYRNSKIIIQSAYYGTNAVQIDEGRHVPDNEKMIDVTELLRNNVSNNGGRYIDINVTNENMGSDPCYMVRKSLYIKYIFDIEPTEVYDLCGEENNRLIFPIV